jgi:hypothetical protein
MMQNGRGEGFTAHIREALWLATEQQSSYSFKIGAIRGWVAPGPDNNGSTLAEEACTLKNSGTTQPSKASCATAEVTARLEKTLKEHSSKRSGRSTGCGWEGMACNVSAVCVCITCMHHCCQSMRGLYRSRNVLPNTTSRLLISTTRKVSVNLKGPKLILMLRAIPTIGIGKPSAGVASGT